ncbi:MAG: hypothetical protein AAGF24_07510 [Cyanobacteria bacterium P01_H01_bin.121]
MAEPMNRKRIFYAGIIVALLGLGLGHVLYNAFKPPYQSRPYQRLGRVYVLVTATGGFFFGMSQEALRQMKRERDREEQQRLLAGQHNNLDNLDGPSAS